MENNIHVRWENKFDRLPTLTLDVGENLERCLTFLTLIFMFNRPSLNMLSLTLEQKKRAG